MTEPILQTNASLSTMWAIKDYPNLNDFFQTAKRLGFQKVELNHQVNSSMLSKVSWDHYQLSSIHEPCPADIPTKELVHRDWLISALDEDSRKMGINAVKKSIDLASKLSAPVVVVHCGMIPFKGNYESNLRKLFCEGKTQSDGYLNIKKQFIELRANLIAPRLLSVKKSLAELVEYASQFHIKLGLENRYHYMDIPIIDEMEDLLSLADSSQLGFIYDVGHAQALDRLGFFPHEDWLKRYSTRMLGCHLHDVVGLTDHSAPGLGEIDFEKISHFIPEMAFRTFELLPGNTLAQVRHGIGVLVKAGCIRYL